MIETKEERKRRLNSIRCKRWRESESNRERERERLAQFRANNREKLREVQRLWRLAHPERARQIKSEWQKRNMQAVLAKGLRWRRANPERAKAIHKRANEKAKLAPDYQEKQRRLREASKLRPWFKDMRRRGHQKRKALKRSARIEKRISYAAVRARCNDICGICNLPVEGKIHYDHIIPLAAGGVHATDNLQIAHPRCNMRKKDRIDWVPEEVCA